MRQPITSDWVGFLSRTLLVKNTITAEPKIVTDKQYSDIGEIYVPWHLIPLRIRG